jgi:hypothetical protein
MAQSTTPASSAQASQTGLVAVLDTELATALTRVDLTDVQTSMPGFFQIVAALVQRYGQASATMAARYYQLERAAAGLGTIHVSPAPLPPLQQVGATLGWATAPLRNGDLATTETNVSGAVDRLVTDVGRRTLVGAVQSDRQAKGWARITRPGACSFCRLMATRGAVYKNEQTAGGDASKGFVGEGEFKFHNHCHCYVEPAFGIYEMTAQAREDLATYKRVTEGLSGAAARNAFRRAVEGRDATGESDVVAGAKPRVPHTPAKVAVSPETARKLIDQFEQSIQLMSQRKGLTDALKAARERIAELQSAL